MYNCLSFTPRWLPPLGSCQPALTERTVSGSGPWLNPIQNLSLVCPLSPPFLFHKVPGVWPHRGVTQANRNHPEQPRQTISQAMALSSQRRMMEGNECVLLCLHQQELTHMIIPILNAERVQSTDRALEHLLVVLRLHLWSILGSILLYLWQEAARCCSSYTGARGSTPQFGLWKVGSCRSSCFARRSWSSLSGTTASRRWLSEKRSTAGPCSDSLLHMCCPHTHTRAPLWSGASLPPLQMKMKKDWRRHSW